MLNSMVEHNLILDKIVFSDEAAFHLQGKVYRHDLIIWESQNPHQVSEHMVEFPKVNGFYIISGTQFYRPFISAQSSITGHVYLDMLDHFLAPQRYVNSAIWQHDVALHTVTGL
jgi:hypothetical protein